ncbi:hypothetical protein HMPREF3192_01268 [Atopobium deltae]|uniref:Uncharacterized protein n=1 Tax=Atopobium deltae TaxID=1393034 RepID=A0A133XQE2_9ACTN|nr:hypothetical protein HMPREF3192_01268 [Atopobium deltae]
MLAQKQKPSLPSWEREGFKTQIAAAGATTSRVACYATHRNREARRSRKSPY